MKRADVALLVAGLAAACAPVPAVRPSSTLQPTPAVAGVPIVLDGGTYTVRDVPDEPMAPIVVGSTDRTTPAIRIGGAPDLAAALRVFAAHCGLDPIQVAGYGGYGDAVRRDPATGEFVLYTACP